MADFTLDGTVLGLGVIAGGPLAAVKSSGLVSGTGVITGRVSPAIVGNVVGIAALTARIVANIITSGLVSGVGVVTGRVSPAIVGLVPGVGVVTGVVRNTPRVSGNVTGVGDVTGVVRWNAIVSGNVTGGGSVIGSPSPTVRGEVTGVGVLTGALPVTPVITGTVGGIGVLSGFVRPNTSIVGTVTGVGVLTGAVRGGPAITGTVTGSQALSGTIRLAAKIQSAVIGVAEVTGSLIRQRTATADAEGAYETTGIRRGLPILVYELNALGPASLTEVPAGGSFLVSASFLGAPGDPFYEAGAAPYAIGTKVQPSVGAAYYVFRQPVANEVVWYVQGEQTYRFQEDRDTLVSSWAKYRTMPQRAGDGMRVFDIFDPDGIYRYFFKLLGSIQYQLGYDNKVLLDQVDPDLASRFYLPELASNYGLSLDFDDDLAVKRAKTRNAVSVYKLKGMDAGVRLRLRSIGFTGYANEIWVAPDDPGNFESTVDNANGTPTSSLTGAGTAYREYPSGYRSHDPVDGYFPSSRVAVHLNDGSGLPIAITQSMKEKVAAELGRDVLPVFVDIRYFVTDVPVGPAEGVVVSDDLDITTV